MSQAYFRPAGIAVRLCSWASCMLFCILFFSACDYFSKPNSIDKGKMVARVNHNYLYEGDLKALMSSDINPQDSSTLAKQYIDNWVYNQLMVQKAEEFLPASSKDKINRKMEEYRSSLIIHQYEKELVNQKVDFEVSEQDIQEYYRNNKKSFTLGQELLKCKYFFIKKNSSLLDSVREWCTDPNEENIGKLEDAGFQNASSFNLTGQWLPLEKIQSQLPQPLKNPRSIEGDSNFTEIEDENQSYFILIERIIEKGNPAPLSYKEQDIKKIIVNKRKQAYIERIKNNIFNEAKSVNSIEIY